MTIRISLRMCISFPPSGRYFGSRKPWPFPLSPHPSLPFLEGPLPPLSLNRHESREAHLGLLDPTRSTRLSRPLSESWTFRRAPSPRFLRVTTVSTGVVVVTTNPTTIAAVSPPSSILLLLLLRRRQRLSSRDG